MSSLSDVIVELPLTSGSRDFNSTALDYLTVSWHSCSITRLVHPSVGIGTTGSLLIPANPNRRAFFIWTSGSNSGVNLSYFFRPDAANKFGCLSIGSNFLGNYAGGMISITGPIWYVTISPSPGSGSFVQVTEVF